MARNEDTRGQTNMFSSYHIPHSNIDPRTIAVYRRDAKKVARQQRVPRMAPRRLKTRGMEAGVCFTASEGGTAVLRSSGDSSRLPRGKGRDGENRKGERKREGREEKQEREEREGIEKRKEERKSEEKREKGKKEERKGERKGERKRNKQEKAGKKREGRRERGRKRARDKKGE